MSGYEDELTGRSVMAGSPDTLLCLDVDFKVLLGECGKPIVGLKHAIELAKKHEKKEILEKLELAEHLVVYAQRLLCYPERKKTKPELARRALEVLGARP